MADDIDRLQSDGRHAEAAAAAAERGEHARAAAIYERIWDFTRAAAEARLAGDLRAALRNLLDARSLDAAAALGRELAGAGQARAAAETFEARRVWDQAGALWEQAGDDERAAGAFQRGGLAVEAAGALLRLGRLREAGRVLEKALHIEPNDARASLALGRVLARLGHHEEAARRLQEAARDEACAPAALALLTVELYTLGLPTAAEDALQRARARDPALPRTVEEVVASAAGRVDPASLVGGRYRLLKPLGAGSAGRVFLARDEVSGAEVALKLLDSASRRHAAWERFVREARLGEHTRHPHIVEILDFRSDLGFLVMELMQGGTLEPRLAPALAPGRVRRLALEILSALSHAHGRGIVHRDIKPANIFFDAHDRAKVGDFGVAHLLDLGQTQTGALIGTLAYMAPEQVTGAPLAATADLYALGVTLFRALTGRLPFLGPDFVAQHLGEVAPAPSQVAAVDPAWDAIIGKLLAKDPAARPASADEAAEAVAALRPEGRAVLSLPRRGAPDPAPTPAPTPNPSAPRYRAETPFGETANSTLSRAVDGTLGRTVVVERFRELDEATERRLLGLAAGTSPFLQRVLSFDRAERVAIYEAPVGRPLTGRAHPVPRRLASELLRALLPVHAAEAAHGAIAPERILLDDETGAVTLLAAGLGPAPEASPADDVRAAAALAGIEPAGDAAAMLAALS
ncbi:MAG TPA: protein kinase [Haliangiales bacterium]|nr:protein kinase [Haliangiales bacterium]